MLFRNMDAQYDKRSGSLEESTPAGVQQDLIDRHVMNSRFSKRSEIPWVGSRWKGIRAPEWSEIATIRIVVDKKGQFSDMMKNGDVRKKAEGNVDEVRAQIFYERTIHRHRICENGRRTIWNEEENCSKLLTYILYLH